jgi:membrane protein DedA with SNARE-associated domain
MNPIQLINDFIQAIKSGSLPQLGPWTYFILAFLVAIEGPVATLLGAIASSAGLMRPGLVFISAATGNLTADSLWYLLGYAGKMDWVMRFAGKLRLKPAILDQLKQNMQDHAAKILFLAKLTVSFMIPSLITAGLLKVPWKRWFPSLLTGEMIWTGSLVLIGYYSTEAIKRVELGLEYAILGLSLLFVIFMLWQGRHFLRNLVQSNSSNSNGE